MKRRGCWERGEARLWLVEEFGLPSVRAESRNESLFEEKVKALLTPVKRQGFGDGVKQDDDW